MAFSSVDELTLRAQELDLGSGMGTSPGTCLAGAGRGTRLDALWASSSVATSRNLEVWLTSPTISLILGTVAIPAGAGGAGVPAVDVLANILSMTDGAIVFPSGWEIDARVTVAVGATEHVFVVAIGADF